MDRTDDQLLLETPYFSVFREDGYYTIRERAEENGVIVVAERADGRLLLARLRRRAIGGYSEEFPRGAIDAGENAVQAAIRELHEETGYGCVRAVRLGKVHSNTSLLGSHVAVVHVRTTDAPLAAGDGEVEALEWLTPVQLDERVAQGLVTDGHTLSAMAMLRAAAQREQA